MPTESLLEQLAHLSPWFAFWSIVVATFVSEDIATITAGMAAAGGIISPLMAVISSALGIWLGDMFYYLLGRGLGFAVLQRPWCARLVRPETVERCRTGFRKRGLRWILTSRFLPGVRTATYFVAGCLGVPAGWFAVTTMGAVILWTPLLVAISWFAGHSVIEWLEDATWLGWLLALAGIFLCWYAARVLLAACTWRGRRRLFARFVKLTRWEYWPRSVLHAPLLVAIPLLALRHRSLRVLSHVNPGLPGGGLLDAPKSLTLAAFAGAGDAIARYRVLPQERSVEERLALMRALITEHGIEYPLVLKPDLGMHGSGVCIVRNEAESRAYLTAIAVDCLVQEFVPGEEFDVCYVRHPNEPVGRIAWIALKEFPSILGDGVHTLEERIYQDRRAVCMVDHFLALAGDTAQRIPALGERVPLAEIGNHCRGTILRDGSALVTKALTLAVDAIAKAHPSCHFGRLDIRAPSTADFQAGRNLRVLEWTSPARSPTHIYDARYGLGFAWRALLAHWQLVFAIASANAQLVAQSASPGPAQPLALRTVLRDWLRYRRGKRSHPAYAPHAKRNLAGDADG
jgi:membrane protein DedA with SNARE-associated domain